MFDVIADRYDAINRVLAFSMDVRWRKVMIQKIKSHLEALPTTTTTTSSEPSYQLLDVATGTADVALLMSKMIPSANIVGVDPSNGMLNVGRKKIAKRKMNDKIVLEWADVRDFSKYDENSFDAGTMAFGIRNIPERDVALCQIYKVLKPRSLFCILEFAEPHTTTPMGKVAGFFIQKVVPYVGGILSGQRKMYKHLQNSIQNFPSPQDFQDMMNGLSCNENGQPSFRVTEVADLGGTFGAVQLYSLLSLKPDDETAPKHIEVPPQAIPVPPTPDQQEQDRINQQAAPTMEGQEEPVVIVAGGAQDDQETLERNKPEPLEVPPQAIPVPPTPDQQEQDRINQRQTAPSVKDQDEPIVVAAQEIQERSEREPLEVPPQEIPLPPTPDQQEQDQ